METPHCLIAGSQHSMFGLFPLSLFPGLLVMLPFALIFIQLEEDEVASSQSTEFTKEMVMALILL